MLSICDMEKLDLMNQITCDLRQLHKNTILSPNTICLKLKISMSGIKFNII